MTWSLAASSAQMLPSRTKYGWTAALDGLLDLGVRVVDQVADAVADLLLPVGQGVDVGVHPRVLVVRHAWRVVNALERPRGGEPGSDGVVEDGVQRRHVRAHPGPAARVEAGVVGRVDVDAADHDVRIGLEDRVREAPAGGEVVRMADEVAPVLGRRHRVRPARAPANRASAGCGPCSTSRPRSPTRCARGRAVAAGRLRCRAPRAARTSPGRRASTRDPRPQQWAESIAPASAVWCPRKSVRLPTVWL